MFHVARGGTKCLQLGLQNPDKEILRKDMVPVIIFIHFTLEMTNFQVDCVPLNQKKNPSSIQSTCLWWHEAYLAGEQRGPRKTVLSMEFSKRINGDGKPQGCLAVIEPNCK